MHLDAVRALRGARDGHGDQLAVLPRDRPFRPADDLVEVQPGLELGRGQLAHHLQEPKIGRVVIMLAHGWSLLSRVRLRLSVEDDYAAEARGLHCPGVWLSCPRRCSMRVA